MPVGLRLSFPENTTKDYDQVCEALNFPADWPDGLLVHASHETPDGHLAVTDVWESRQHFDRFVEDRLTAAMGTLGDRARQPEIVERELHTFYRG
jgi:hypothetical protein